MNPIIPIILAAGDSSRMGYPKALLPLGQGTFVTHILRTLSTLRFANIIVVLGQHDSRIRPVLAPYSVRILTNPDPSRGQMSSLRLAAENLEPGYRGGLIWPVDQPFVSAELVGDLVRLFLSSAAPLALPRCGEKPGHPAILGCAMIEEFLAAPLHTSPKTIVSRYKHEAAWLTTTERGTVEDVDTPDDYFRLTGMTLDSALAGDNRAAGR